MNSKKYGLLLLSLMSTIAIAEERLALNYDALPKAVQTTVSRYIDQAHISKIEQVTDTGYIKFEITSMKAVNNKDFINIDLTVSSTGEIIKMAKEVPFFDIPFSVMKQVNQRYPNLKVDEVESVRTRYFHLTGKSNGQPVNLKINDDGEIQELTADQNSQD